MRERSAFEDERKLLDFARSHLSEAFPNPKRVGCPSDDALRLLAIRPMQSDASTGEHLTCCSPCFTAYMAHLARAKAEAIQRRRNRRAVWISRSATALGVAAILAIAVYMFITKRRTEPIIAPRIPAPITAPGNPAQTRTATYVPVVIDLSNVSPDARLQTKRRRLCPAKNPLGFNVRFELAFAAWKRRAPVLDNIEVKATYRVVGVNASTPPKWRHAFAGARGFQPRPCRTL